MKEICICAAVKTTDGIIIRGHRHSDCMVAIWTLKKEPSKKNEDHGFITSHNRFVDREEGAKLFNESGATSVYTNKVGVKDILFSEDLY
jgi:uncharacterized radical SAM superfamily protein